MEPSEYAGAQGLNFFTEDRLLQAVLKARLPKAGQKAAFARLSALGADCGGELSRLVEAAHRDENRPRLERYDRWGNRQDAVVYCSEQLAARNLAFSHGCLPPTPLVERMAKAYLLNQLGEGGITCPLTMTDGLIQLLESRGTPEQKKRWLPLLRDPKVEPAFCAGQYVTEKQGGSNVSENETRAEPQADGSWRLTGLKWFCSNPAELWVTTAKPAGSEAVGLFLVPRRRPDGSLNDCHVLRLKDLSGTWGKATAEVEYRGAYAEAIGRPAHGMVLLLHDVLRVSRLHVAAGSLGFLRRAYLEASLYARSRVVLGRPLEKFPNVSQTLARLEALWTACLLAYFEELALVERGNPAAEVLVPLLKIEVTRAASEGVRQARLLLAGNGMLRDFSILPRLSEDALAQEIWEGTHPILAGHVLRALLRPASRKAFLALLRAQDAGALNALLGKAGAGPAEDRAPEALRACGLAWRALTLSLLTRGAGGALDADLSFARLAAVLEAA